MFTLWTRPVLANVFWMMSHFGDPVFVIRGDRKRFIAKHTPDGYLFGSQLYSIS